MKTPRCWAVLILISLLHWNSAVSAAAANPAPRLTVELRDGSRVVGSSVEEKLRFHSALLGDLKLEVKDIRSVACVSSNSAKLTTNGGDTLTVSFVDPVLVLKTSFGKVDLATDAVRRLMVSASDPSAHPPGLVALWSGEDNGKDSGVSRRKPPPTCW